MQVGRHAIPIDAASWLGQVGAALDVVLRETVFPAVIEETNMQSTLGIVRRFAAFTTVLVLCGGSPWVGVAQVGAPEGREAATVGQATYETDVERVGERTAESEDVWFNQMPYDDPAFTEGWPLWGGLFSPKISYEVRHDDNVFFAPDDMPTVSDIVHNMGAGFRFFYPEADPLRPQPATVTTLDYLVSRETFQQGNAPDNTRHDLEFGATFIRRKFDVSLGYGLDVSASPTLQEGGRVRQLIQTPAVSVKFNLAPRLASIVDLLYIDTSVERNIDTQHASGRYWVDFDYSPRTKIGAGVGGGTDIPSIGSDSVFQQLQMRVAYDPSPRLSFQLSSGVESRQFSSSADNLVAPVLDLSLTYHIGPATTLTLQGNRALRPSNFIAGQIREDLSGTASIQQRFLRKYFVMLSGTVGDAGFQASDAAFADLNDQSYYNVQIRAWRDFENGFRADIFLSQTGRGATTNRNALENNMVGISLLYLF